MASVEGRRHHHNLVPLAALISRELKNEKMEKPTVRYGHAAQSRKGEDYFLIKTDGQRVPGNSSSTFSAFAVILSHLYFHTESNSRGSGLILLNHETCPNFRPLMLHICAQLSAVLFVPLISPDFFIINVLWTFSGWIRSNIDSKLDGVVQFLLI